MKDKPQSRAALVGLLIAVLVVLLLARQAAAMSSPNYQLDWYTPLTSGGGGPSSSTNYQVNLTVGQSGVGTASSANYGTTSGYWSFSLPGYQVDLPIILR